MAGTPDPNAPHTTNPLGGRIHDRQARAALLRQWSGYVALVRTCPILGKVKVLRQWSGCYDITPDANPIDPRVGQPW